MSTTETQNSPVALKLRVLHVIRSAIAAIARLFFSLYYGSDGVRLPPITDDILKQPAVEVARKIRNKEVNAPFIRRYKKSLFLFFLVE